MLKEFNSLKFRFFVFKFNFCIMEKKLRRSQNKMFAGVCAGIAEYFNLDPTLIRVAYVLVSIFSAGFPGLLIYIILMLVIPQAEADI